MTLAKPVRTFAVALLVGLATSAGAGRRSAKFGSCEQVIARAGASYLAAYTDTLRRCEKLRLQGVLSAAVDCQTNSADELQGIRIDLEDAIGKACGGADKICGTADDVTLAEAGWADVTQCPDIDGSGCTNAISNCADVAECIACTGAAAANEVASLTFDRFTTSEFGTKSDVNACQQAIGGATTKFLEVSAKALAKCWSSLPPQSLSAPPQALQITWRFFASAFATISPSLPVPSGQSPSCFPDNRAHQHFASAFALT
jgi:hypothetical protein